jgi:hypothetical protein
LAAILDTAESKKLDVVLDAGSSAQVSGICTTQNQGSA